MTNTGSAQPRSPNPDKWSPTRPRSSHTLQPIERKKCPIEEMASGDTARQDLPTNSTTSSPQWINDFTSSTRSEWQQPPTNADPTSTPNESAPPQASGSKYKKTTSGKGVWYCCQCKSGPHTRWHSFCSNCRHRCDKCKLRSPFPSKGSAAGAKRSDRLEKKSTNVHQPWVDDDPWICPACMSKISAQYDKCPMCNRGFKL